VQCYAAEWLSLGLAGEAHARAIHRGNPPPTPLARRGRHHRARTARRAVETCSELDASSGGTGKKGANECSLWASQAPRAANASSSVRLRFPRPLCLTRRPVGPDKRFRLQATPIPSFQRQRNHHPKQPAPRAGTTHAGVRPKPMPTSPELLWRTCRDLGFQKEKQSTGGGALQMGPCAIMMVEYDAGFVHACGHA
jgi:hypothetical protein